MLAKKEKSTITTFIKQQLSFTERIYFFPNFDLQSKRGIVIMCNSCKNVQYNQNILIINHYCKQQIKMLPF